MQFSIPLPGLVTSPKVAIRERKLDQVLADSFPASDPPPWTLGRVTTATPSPADASRSGDGARSVQTTVIVAGGSRTAWQWLASGFGAIGVTMLVPIGILVVGIPIALAVRALLEVVGWLAGVGS